MKKVLFTLVAALLVTVSFAQDGRGGQRRQREFSPEEVALYQTEKLNEALLLDSIQYQAVLLMNYADALTMQDSMNARRARMEQRRATNSGKRFMPPSEEQINAQIQVQREREKVRNEQMKQILNAEQYEKYLKLQADEKKRVRHERGGRGGRMPRQ